jgi:broad specificity phosphatase PhoE
MTNEPTIVLIRHGRSAHVHAGWIDLAGFQRWRAAYEAAGIDPLDRPPAPLQALASTAGAIVTSDIPRAVESARLLAPGAQLLVSPLLRELALVPPNLRRIRLPLLGWALTYGLRMLVRGRGHVTADEEERARQAATWLAGLAREHGHVAVVTHHTFRSVLAKELQSRSWHAAIPRRKSAHWSAWILTDRSVDSSEIRSN